MIRASNKSSIVMAVVLIVLMILTTACGGSTTVVPSDSATKAAAETSPPENEVTTTPATESETNEPANADENTGDCPDTTSVTIASTNGAYESRQPIGWDNIGTQEAYVSRSYGTTSVDIYIANFTTSEGLKSYKPNDGESILHFQLRIRGEGNEVAIELGEYNLKDYDASDLHVTPKILLSGGSALQISTHDIASSEFVVTGISDTQICGTFNVDEKWTQMSGTFVVPFVK